MLRLQREHRQGDERQRLIARRNTVGNQAGPDEVPARRREPEGRRAVRRVDERPRLPERADRADNRLEAGPLRGGGAGIGVRACEVRHDAGRAGVRVGFRTASQRARARAGSTPTRHIPVSTFTCTAARAPALSAASPSAATAASPFTTLPSSAATTSGACSMGERPRTRIRFADASLAECETLLGYRHAQSPGAGFDGRPRHGNEAVTVARSPSPPPAAACRRAHQAAGDYSGRHPGRCRARRRAYSGVSAPGDSIRILRQPRWGSLEKLPAPTLRR